MFAQAATAVVTSPGGAGIAMSLGTWLAIIAAVVALGGLLIRFGELKADTRNLRASTEKAVTDLQNSVGKELIDIKQQLTEVLTFIHESQHQRVLDAGWQERTTANLTTAMKDAEQARETAHNARDIATQAVISANKGRIP